MALALALYCLALALALTLLALLTSLPPRQATFHVILNKIPPGLSRASPLFNSFNFPRYTSFDPVIIIFSFNMSKPSQPCCCSCSCCFFSRLFARNADTDKTYVLKINHSSMLCVTNHESAAIRLFTGPSLINHTVIPCTVVGAGLAKFGCHITNDARNF